MSYRNQSFDIESSNLICSTWFLLMKILEIFALKLQKSLSQHILRSFTFDILIGDIDFPLTEKNIPILIG